MDQGLADKCKIPQALWRAFDKAGIAPSAILRHARLPATLHINPQAVITTAQLFAIWKSAEALACDAGLAIKLVHASDTSGHQPIFLAAGYAADYRDGLSRIFRFKRLTTSERLNVVEREGRYTIVKKWPYATEPEPLTSVALSFAFVVHLGRRGTQHEITPVRVEFAQEGAPNPAYDAFFQCPVQYGAKRNALILHSADLDRPFPNHSRELLEILTPALTAALSDASMASGVGDQVKLVLKRRLASGRPDLGVVASDLGMSERTLQRRIGEAGASFRTLLAEARQELGRDLLANPELDVDEVACLLGFQDTSSFYRAFRDWEGMTPLEWQRRNDRRPQSPPH